jgi:glycosyltransferase involved in cell wall biosynthesis
MHNRSKKHKARIVFISHTSYPEFIGGREKHINNLASSLSRHYEIFVVAGGKCKTEQKTALSGYTLIQLPVIPFVLSRKPLQIYRIIPRLFATLRRLEPDIIHAFEYGSFSTSVSSFYARKASKPFFLTLYGYQLNNPLLKAGKIIYDYFFGRQILKNSKNIFCSSKSQYYETLRITDVETLNQKIVFQPNCIPVDDYRKISSHLTSEIFFSGKKTIKILSTARMLPRKGLKFLIMAIEQLVFQFKICNIQLVLAGPDRGGAYTLNKMIKAKKLTNYIKNVGPLGHEQIKEILHACDIFILPSLYEALPLGLLEAMASGKAVIFSELPCSRQVIKHNYNGILVEPGNTNRLAAAIKKLICDSTLRNYLGKNAQTTIVEFDSSQEAINTGKIYRNSLARNFDK